VADVERAGVEADPAGSSTQRPAAVPSVSCDVAVDVVDPFMRGPGTDRTALLAELLQAAVK
jgi:hypothetical protein